MVLGSNRNNHNINRGDNMTNNNVTLNSMVQAAAVVPHSTLARPGTEYVEVTHTPGKVLVTYADGWQALYSYNKFDGVHSIRNSRVGTWLHSEA
jgi:hypothetical protein